MHWPSRGEKTNLCYCITVANVDSHLASQVKLEKKFGQSPVFVASTLLENGGLPMEASTSSLLKEAIHVISCGYEDKTEWGKEVRPIHCFFVTEECSKFGSITHGIFNLLTRLGGFMAPSRKISWLDSRCIATDGGPFIVCLSGLLSRAQPLLIFRTVSIRFLGGL